MSVHRTDYIFFGYKLPFKFDNIDLNDDKFLPMIEGHKGEEFRIIRDGMSGEYTVFGLQIETADEYVGWKFKKIKFENLDSEKVKNKYREVFEIEEKEPIAEPYLCIFSHFH